jgi:DNA segregation ATPase FtsK/SpoIIIE-like protein
VTLKIIAYIMLSILATFLGTLAYNLYLWLRQRQTENACYCQTLNLDAESQRVDVERQRHLLERDKLLTEAQRIELDRQRLAITEKVYPDPDTGQYPLLWDGQRLLDADRGLVLTIPDGVIGVTPQITVPEQQARLLRAAGGWPPGGGNGSASMLSPPQTVNWPQSVTLDDLLKRYDIKPSFRCLLLGVTHKGGQWQPVVGDLADMIHVLISGASGFGKSTLAEAIAKQLVLAGDCDLCAVDYGVNTFGALAGHFMYPIADSAGMTAALFAELIRVLRVRKSMMRDYPMVKTIAQYNETTGDDLRPIVCLVDEASVLFAKSGQLKDLTIELSQTARKFGLGLILCGTDFKADTLPTEATGNFGARIAFHLRPSLSQSLLYSREAAELHDKGRVKALLPGNSDLTEAQAPIVRRWDDLPPSNGKQHELEPCQEEAGDDYLEKRILSLAEQGLSKNAIQREVFGYTGGKAYEVVTRVLSDTTTTEGGTAPSVE